jgi:hypothetical protein
MKKSVTVVETPAFSAKAKNVLTVRQIEDIAVVVAENPTCGDLLTGTGGCRKTRFALEGRGKSGSVRFVHLYCGDNTPTFLLTLFAKNEKSNLTKAEKNKLKKIANLICKTYGAKK